MALPEFKRKKIEELVIGTISRLEVGDENTKRYKALFKSMNDDEFEEWARKFKKDEFDNVLQIYIEPFKEPRMQNIEAAADYLHLPLVEYVYYNDHPGGPVRTKERVPVGYVHVKRVQQLLSKKNHYSFDNESRSLKSGQVSGDSKVASLSEPEVSGLAAIDADQSIKEFMTFRSDDSYGKMQAYKQIIDQGFISMNEIERNQSSAGQAIETLNAYLLAAGIHTDLVSSSLKTRYTLEQETKNRS